MVSIDAVLPRSSSLFVISHSAQNAVTREIWAKNSQVCCPNSAMELDATGNCRFDA
jgi:hypothetical protein